jgi:hypothetical protein
MGVGGQCHALAASPPGETWYPLYRRLGVPQGQSGRVQKISLLPGFHTGPSSTSPVAIPTELSWPHYKLVNGDFMLPQCLEKFLSINFTIKKISVELTDDMNYGCDMVVQNGMS